ncbi:MAG: hypothetical protein KU37_02105 [Sulfuricurvum sp. PC08-66]|nr:MAG: hypothetical protein KU37_02105 [Sulfuricurvum sp. PC08-66]
MLKLHQIFFNHFLVIFLVSFGVMSTASYFYLKESEISQSKAHLISAINLVELQLPHVVRWDTFTQNVGHTTKLRLTIVAKDGTVLAESGRDKSDMDNHAKRAEIIESMHNPYGASIRYSHSLNRDFLYMAKRVTIDKELYYIRMAIPLERLLDDFYGSWLQLLAIFALLVAVAFLFSYRISGRIERDVKELIFYLKQIAEKNYKAPLKTRFSSEFVQISTVLKSVIAKLERREKQKRKYTARLRLMNKQRNDILSAMGHELKNPLAAIQGFAQTLLAEPYSAQKSELFDRFLVKIVDNSQKISAMVDRIALAVKLENGDLTPQMSEVAVSKMVADAVTTLRKKYPERIIHIEVTDAIVRVDRTMIEMVIINLLDNALKYSNGDVRVRFEKNRLSVIDHGMGIESQEIEKITTKFYRVDKNSWDNSMGLGLAIVGYILRLHETTLHIQSEVGKGSIFSFRLSKTAQEEQ